MERSFRHDFSRVRVHTDACAAESAHQVNALAYTVGQHVVFAAGRFAPETNPGRALLAHELAHTIQQQGALLPAELKIGKAKSPLEKEAAIASASALAGRPPRSSAYAAPHLQCQTAADVSSPGTSFPDNLVEGASPFLASALGSATLEGFSTGSSNLTPRHLADVKTVAQQIILLLRQYPLSKVRITGHTDTVGTETNNLALGLKRAEAVHSALIAQGVPEEVIVTSSAGEGPPFAVRTADNVSNARNRRAVITFEPSTTKLPPILPELRAQPLPDISYHPPKPPDRPPPYLPPRSEPTLPAPRPDDIEEAFGGLIQTKSLPENPRPHASVDLSSGTTSNAPPGTNPTVYTVTLIWRNWNVKTFGSKEATVALDVAHEPNVGITISPDPQNRQIYQAAVTLLNLHLRRHGEDLVEIGVSAQGQVNNTGTLGGAAQAQVELHLTSRFSFTASTSIGVGPNNPQGPQDRGSIGVGRTVGGSWNWTPFSVGTVIHF